MPCSSSFSERPVVVQSSVRYFAQSNFLIAYGLHDVHGDVEFIGVTSRSLGHDFLFFLPLDRFCYILVICSDQRFQCSVLHVCSL